MTVENGELGHMLKQKYFCPILKPYIQMYNILGLLKQKKKITPITEGEGWGCDTRNHSKYYTVKQKPALFWIHFPWQLHLTFTPFLSLSSVQMSRFLEMKYRLLYSTSPWDTCAGQPPSQTSCKHEAFSFHIKTSPPHLLCSSDLSSRH